MFRVTKSNYINKNFGNMTFSFWIIIQWNHKDNTNNFECGVV